MIIKTITNPTDELPKIQKIVDEFNKTIKELKCVISGNEK